MNKLVSAITGTYNRHDLLIESIESLAQQTYRPLEQVIVTDGRDRALITRIAQEYREYRVGPNEYCYKNMTIRVTETGRQWSKFLAASITAVPFQVAQWMAQGDYLVWYSDDERMDPTHIEKLVNLLESTESDFVYSYARIVFNQELGMKYALLPPRIIGTDPPRIGSITNALYRVELLDYRGFRTHIGSGSDHDQVLYWIECGARYAMLDEVTITHRVDKMGEGPDYKTERQPLYGHRTRTSDTVNV